MLYLFTMMTGFVIGIMANAHVRRLENLTKEQYSHCVQMALNELGQSWDNAEILNELQSYAMDEQAELHHLSHCAQEIVMRVKAIA